MTTHEVFTLAGPELQLEERWTTLRLRGGLSPDADEGSLQLSELLAATVEDQAEVEVSMELTGPDGVVLKKDKDKDKGKKTVVTKDKDTGDWLVFRPYSWP